MIYSLFILVLLVCTANPLQATNLQRQKILIVLGSARDHSVSKKIAHVVGDSLADYAYEIVDLHNLPLVNLEQPDNNNLVHEWQNKFQQASVVIFLAPNYNGGYTGVLKNGIDALGASASGKKIALIGYSGGYEAQEPIAALMPALKTLQMQVVGEPVLIPMADSAFDFEGNIKKSEIKKAIDALIDTLLKTIKE